VKPGDEDKRLVIVYHLCSVTYTLIKDSVWTRKINYLAY